MHCIFYSSVIRRKQLRREKEGENSGLFQEQHATVLFHVISALDREKTFTQSRKGGRSEKPVSSLLIVPNQQGRYWKKHFAQFSFFQLLSSSSSCLRSGSTECSAASATARPVSILFYCVCVTWRTVIHFLDAVCTWSSHCVCSFVKTSHSTATLIVI